MALRIEWTDEARADIRALDRVTAMHIFNGLNHYTVTGAGDVKALKGRHAGKLRLRTRRLPRFFSSDAKVLRILAVKKREEAYW